MEKMINTPGLWDSFIERVNQQGECWLWTGAKINGDGYGLISIFGKTRLAHRVSYELWYGQFPLDLDVCHKCDNHPCVRPAHLFLGTALENMRDKMKKGRWKGGRPRGSVDTGLRRNRRKMDTFDRQFIRNTSSRSPEELAKLMGVSVAEIEAVLSR